MLNYKYILLILLLLILIISLYSLYKNNYLKFDFNIETFKNIEFFNNCSNENEYILDKNIIMKIINQI
jgi:hypothetical protein